MTNFDEIGQLKVSGNSTIADVIERIQESGPVACALFYDQEGQFVNIITDGDVRRAILKGHKLEDSALEIIRIKHGTGRPEPITAHVQSSLSEREDLFQRHTLRQLILVDSNGIPMAIVDHASINRSPTNINRNFTAVVMAGGFGTRLRPLTENTPKPMLPINGRPMLEISIEKLVKHGANRIYISTHYLPEQIVDHFGNGDKFGVSIEYLHEEVPLGTGGALSRLPFQDEHTLVFNGDILTNLDVGMFLAYHLKSKSAMTIAATQYRFQIPFGVITESGSVVSNIEEKPNLSFLVNSGIYFISKSVFETLPKSGHYNMTDVAHNLIKLSSTVSCFPIFEHWLDVGRPSDYDLASKFF